MNTRWNKYQSTIEELDLKNEPEEIQEQFWDFIENVPYIRSLISEDRPRACDLPRDADGKIIVDIAKPHILENMEYFMQTAIIFKKTGKYTNLRPNKNPNSEFGKWIRQEVRRCYDGMVRPSDGEWITGNMYYFLNYCPIPMTKTKKGSKKGERIVDFPEVWEGIYYRFHYIEQARNGGIYCKEGGKNGSEISSRGKSKSLTMASILSKYFILGESASVKNNVKTMVTAYQKQYLTSDGILNKFQSFIDFSAQNTQFPARRLRSSLQDMSWKMGYVDLDTGTQMGPLNETIGVSAKDDTAKVRGKRLHFIVVEEFGSFKNILSTYNVMLPSVREGDISFGEMYLIGCCCAGTKVWTLDGRNLNIEDLKKEDGIIGFSKIGFKDDIITTYCNGITREPIGTILNKGIKDCYRITLSNGNSIECSDDHPLLILKKHSHRYDGDKRIFTFEELFRNAVNLKIGDRVCEARCINVFGTDTLFDARLVGMLIGDGSYGYNNTPRYYSEDKVLLDYVKSKYSWSLTATHNTKKNNIYEEIRVKGICKNLREIGIYGQTKTNKRLPLNYQTLDYNNTIDLLSGLYDTDGCVHFRQSNSSITITQCNREILIQIQILLRKIGVVGTIVKYEPRISVNRKDRNPWYTLVCAGRYNVINFAKHIKLLVPHKINSLNKCVQWYNDNTSKKEADYSKDYIVHKITNIEYLGKKEVYNLSACNSHTYLANNIITHNTAGDSDSDFQGAQEIIYNPDGYYMYPLPNVFDKEGQGRPHITFFFPGYINRKGCYDENGNSDVTKAILEILKDRYLVKYNSTDINTITRTIAEIPIVPQEALLRTVGNIFPITALNERLTQLDSDPKAYDDVYVGDFTQDSSGNIVFRNTTDTPIRDFPTKDNKFEGAVEIYEMPQKSGDKVPYERYIMSLDNYENDVSNTMSLGSMFVLDLWTDRIVAEYTGRPMFSDDLNELARKMALFYNAKIMYENNKKNTFAYFSKVNSLHLLADVPEYLKNRQLIKTIGYGNLSKGITATTPIKNFGFSLIRDWLLKEVPTVIKEDGQDKEIKVANLFFLKNRALIKELILFNPDINVDRIMSLVQLMLYREEKMILYQGNPRSSESRTNCEDLANDAFFTTNYDERFGTVSQNNIDI